jgi:hypothetical protein
MEVPMTEVSANQLANAIEGQHGGRARFIQSMPVREEFDGQVVAEGLVHVFDLVGHPIATRAYAWTSPIEGSTKRRFYTVLGKPPINSAADAVRAVIVAEQRGRETADEIQDVPR